jgi:hypothetical protein
MNEIDILFTIMAFLMFASAFQLGMVAESVRKRNS